MPSFILGAQTCPEAGRQQPHPAGSHPQNQQVERLPSPTRRCICKIFQIGSGASFSLIRDQPEGRVPLQVLPSGPAGPPGMPFRIAGKGPKEGAEVVAFNLNAFIDSVLEQ